MVLFVEMFQGCLTCPGVWGCSVYFSICDSSGKICSTSPQGRDAYPRAAGEGAVDSRHEGRGLFMADCDEFDLFRLAERVGDSKSLLTWNLKDKFYLLVLQASH